MQKEFIRNFLDVEVDGFNYTVRYIGDIASFIDEDDLENE